MISLLLHSAGNFEWSIIDKRHLDPAYNDKIRLFLGPVERSDDDQRHRREKEGATPPSNVVRTVRQTFTDEIAKGSEDYTAFKQKSEKPRAHRHRKSQPPDGAHYIPWRSNQSRSLKDLMRSGFRTGEAAFVAGHVPGDCQHGIRQRLARPEDHQLPPSPPHHIDGRPPRDSRRAVGKAIRCRWNNVAVHRINHESILPDSISQGTRPALKRTEPGKNTTVGYDDEEATTCSRVLGPDNPANLKKSLFVNWNANVD